MKGGRKVLVAPTGYTPAQRKAYKLGRSRRGTGHSLDANYFPKRSKEWHAWNRGWHDRDAELPNG